MSEFTVSIPLDADLTSFDTKVRADLAKLEQGVTIPVRTAGLPPEDRDSRGRFLPAGAAAARAAQDQDVFARANANVLRGMEEREALAMMRSRGDLIDSGFSASARRSRISEFGEDYQSQQIKRRGGRESAIENFQPRDRQTEKDVDALFDSIFDSAKREDKARKQSAEAAERSARASERAADAAERKDIQLENREAADRARSQRQEESAARRLTPAQVRERVSRTGNASERAEIYREAAAAEVPGSVQQLNFLARANREARRVDLVEHFKNQFEGISGALFGIGAVAHLANQVSGVTEAGFRSEEVAPFRSINDQLQTRLAQLNSTGPIKSLANRFFSWGLKKTDLFGFNKNAARAYDDSAERVSIESALESFKTDQGFADRRVRQQEFGGRISAIDSQTTITGTRDPYRRQLEEAKAQFDQTISSEQLKGAALLEKYRLSATQGTPAEQKIAELNLKQWTQNFPQLRIAAAGQQAAAISAVGALEDNVATGLGYNNEAFMAARRGDSIGVARALARAKINQFGPQFDKSGRITNFENIDESSPEGRHLAGEVRAGYADEIGAAGQDSIRALRRNQNITEGTIAGSRFRSRRDPVGAGFSNLVTQNANDIIDAGGDATKRNDAVRIAGQRMNEFWVVVKQQISDSAEDIEASTQATKYLTAGDPINAIKSGAEGRRKAALRGLPDNWIYNKLLGGDRLRAGINEQIDAERDRDIKNVNDRIDLQKQGLLADVDVTGLQAKGRPAAAQAMAIRRQAEISADAIKKEGGPQQAERIKALYDAAINREQTLARDLQLRGLGGSIQEVAGGALGPGGFKSQNPQEEELTPAIQAVEKAIKDLQAALLGAQ